MLATFHNCERISNPPSSYLLRARENSDVFLIITLNALSNRITRTNEMKKMLAK